MGRSHDRDRLPLAKAFFYQNLLGRVSDQSPDGSISGRDFLITYNEYLYTKYALR